MTDNEIIKALECCESNNPVCDVCPMNKFRIPGTGNCINKILIGAIDLINRQKAEIERLNEKITAKDENNYYFMGQLRLAREKLLTAKSEAIKKFAEELEYFVLNEDIEVVEPKCKDYESYINGANQFRHQIKNGINNLVKEMTEDKG